ncbi:hypothetical protein [Niabella hibiscisoli]|uniref:hypothetical protein n=1 Tax=Niabella hibiscisoli TaxID=1825928 RepID=UPI001F0DCEC4|nr:hypothetical protein [Niabella hibiscisoli]MCH5718477.1 hypothetical protein [Niabella hibiscisoli]
MKKIIGLLIVLCSIALIGIIVLRIWGIELVSTGDVLRSGATLVLLAVLTIILVIVYGVFFRDPKKGYQRPNGENRAHPKL